MPKSTLPSSCGEEKQEGTMRAVPVPAPPCPTAGPGHFLQGSGFSVAHAAAERAGGFLLRAGALPGRTLPGVGRGTSKLALLQYPTLPSVDAVPGSLGELVQARPGDAEAVPGPSSLWTASMRSRDGSSSLAWDREQPKPSRRKVQENMAWVLLGVQNFQWAVLHTREGPQH